MSLLFQPLHRSILFILSILQRILRYHINNIAPKMSLSNKLSITDVDVKDKRVLIRVSYSLY